VFFVFASSAANNMAEFRDIEDLSHQYG